MSPCVLTALFLSGLVAGADRDEALVQQRIQQIKDSDSTAWRKIPWAASLLDARRASHDEGKPVFLFTHDGNIDTGRC